MQTTGQSSLKFIAVVAGTALALHAAVSVAAALAMPRLYPHRIFNVRAWSDAGDERYHLVGAFLREQSRRPQPLIAFVGSSVTYGYPWNEQFIFSRLLAEQTPGHLINASILATDITGLNDWVVCGAWRNRVRFKVLVIEIPVVSSVLHLVGARRGGRRVALAEGCPPGDADRGYLQLAALRPRGLGWVRFLWDSEARERRELVVGSDPAPEGTFTSAADFDVVRGDYSAAIQTLLINARQIADAIAVFPSPIYLGGLAMAGVDAEAVRTQLRASVDACLEVPGVRCLDLSALWMQPSYFVNLTHLNQAGHRAAADALLPTIQSPRPLTSQPGQ